MITTYEERIHKEAAELAEKLGQNEIFCMKTCHNADLIDVSTQYINGGGYRVHKIDLSHFSTRVRWFGTTPSTPIIYANSAIYDGNTHFFRTAEDAMQDARDWKGRGEINLSEYWIGGIK